MDEKYIISRLDEIKDKISDIDKTLAVNTEILDIHVKRTNTLELLVQQNHAAAEKQMQEALVPIHAIRSTISASITAGKFLAALSAAGSAIWGVLRYLKLP